jgi:hypothetical protein
VILDGMALIVVLALAVLFGWLVKRAWGSRRGFLKWPALLLSGLLALIIALIFVVVGIGIDELYSPPGASAQKTLATWLCRPGMSDNPCEANHATTVVPPSGTTSIQAAEPAKDPPPASPPPASLLRPSSQRPSFSPPATRIASGKPPPASAFRRP